ncbi:mechanosensitive ion channel family protein [Sulfurimonas sp.]
MIQKFLFSLVFLFFIPLGLLAQQSTFTPFIDQQIKLIKKLNDNNLSQEEVQAIVTLQDKLYDQELERILSNKESYLKQSTHFESKIFSLQKIININKRRGNTYAVARDEILVLSYRVLNHQTDTIKKILVALDMYEFDEFVNHVAQLISANDRYVNALNIKKYQYLLHLQDDAKTLRDAKRNLEDYYALVTVNSDYMQHVILLERKLYRLNKYSKYNLIKAVLYVNNTALSQSIEPVLNYYNLSTAKLLLIFLVIIVVYLVRKVLIDLLIKFLLRIEFINIHAKEVVSKLRKPIEIFTILINVDLIVYIYHDFSSSENVNMSFNIFYAVIFIWAVFIIINRLAKIKIREIEASSKSVKSEVVNVGIKIVNFTIFLIGLLLVLHFAGVNLTAILSGLGIGGLAVALAAKDSLSNFFGTLSILLSDTFSQGDWISIKDKEGVVVEIGLRVTTIRTFDNALIAIPNATLANEDVKNWNKRVLGRRIKMKLGVKYDSKKDAIQKAVIEIRQMLKNHPDIATKETKYEFSKYKNSSSKLVSKDDELGVKRILLVYLDEFAPSSIDILIYCFSKSVMWEDWLRVKEDVMYKIMEILEMNNLEFAFPSLSIYEEDTSS